MNLKRLLLLAACLLSLAAHPASAQVSVTKLTDTVTGTSGTLMSAHTSDNGVTYTSSNMQIDSANRMRSNVNSADAIATPQITVTNGTIVASCDMTVLDQTQLMAINFFPSVTAAGYHTYYQPSSSNTVILRNNGGAGTTLANPAYTYTTGNTYHLTSTLTYNGTSVAVTNQVNGVTVASYTDTSASVVAGPYIVTFEIYGGTTGDTAGIHLDNLSVVGIVSASASPSALLTGQGNQTVTLSGYNTAYSTSSGTQFTLSGGTGASIVTQSASTATTASLTINPGTAPGTLTITGPSGETTAITVSTPTAPTAPAVALDNSQSADKVIVYTASSPGYAAIAGYALYRGTGTGTEGATALATSTTGAFAGLAKGNYYYVVKAYDNEGTPLYSAASNEVGTATAPAVSDASVQNDMQAALTTQGYTPQVAASVTATNRAIVLGTGAVTSATTPTTTTYTASLSISVDPTGDEVTWLTGVNTGKVSHVLSYAAGAVTLAAALPAAPSTGDTFSLSPYGKGLVLLTTGGINTATGQVNVGNFPATVSLSGADETKIASIGTDTPGVGTLLARPPQTGDAYLELSNLLNSGKTAFTAPALANAPTGSGGGSGPTAVQIRQEIDANSTQLAALVSGQSSLQTSVSGVQTAVTGVQTSVAGVPAAILARSVGHGLTVGQLLVLLQASSAAGVTNTWNPTTHTLTTAYQFSGDSAPVKSQATVYPPTQLLAPGVTGQTTTLGTVPQP